MSEAGKISQKIKVWFSDYFNVSDFLAIVTFFAGFGLRLAGGEAFVPGRTVYCLNIVFWYVRLLDILAVNQQAGPYVMMIAKMVSPAEHAQSTTGRVDWWLLLIRIWTTRMYVRMFRWMSTQTNKKKISNIKHIF